MGIAAANRGTGGSGGIVPMRMSAAEGLERLHAAGIAPELIFVDAAMDYQQLKSDLRLCRRYFPDAVLCGAGWEVEAVSRAVKDVAWRDGDGLVHAEGVADSLRQQGALGQGWVMGAAPDAEALKGLRSQHYDNVTDNTQAQEQFRQLEKACTYGEAGAELLRELCGIRGE